MSVNAADIRSAGNGYLDEYDEARCALMVLRKRLFGIGHSMMQAGGALKSGEPVGSRGHPPTSLDTILVDIGDFEATLDKLALRVDVGCGVAGTGWRVTLSAGLGLRSWRGW